MPPRLRRASTIGAMTRSSSTVPAPELWTVAITCVTSLSGNASERSTWTSTDAAIASAPALLLSASHRGGAAVPPSGPTTACSQRTTSIRPAAPVDSWTRRHPIPAAWTDPGRHAPGRGPGGGRQPSLGPATPCSTLPVASSPPPGQRSVSSSLTRIPRLDARTRTSRRARQSPVARSRARPGAHAGRGAHPSSVAIEEGPHAAAPIAGATHAPRTRRRSERQPTVGLAVAGGGRLQAAALARPRSVARIRPEHTPPP